MATGMGVDTKCVEEFKKMKLNRTHKMMTFKIDGDKIVIDETAKDGNIETIKKLLPDQDCRYAVYDAIDGDKKIHFILWTPESSNVKSRMTYAASKDCLHKQLEGVQPIPFQAHDKSDFAQMPGVSKAPVG